MISRSALTDGWSLRRSDPGQFESPPGDGGEWLSAVVPGTTAGVVGDEVDGDAYDWWYRVELVQPPAAAGEEVVLEFDGLATVSEVWCNDVCVARSESMFMPLAIDIGELLRPDGANSLALCFRALAPLLAQRRKPRARWRTKLVSAANLRFYRTMLLGRAPGFAPGPAVVGPFRAVNLARRSGIVAERVRLRSGMSGGDAVVSFSVSLRGVSGTELPDEVTLSTAGASVRLPVAPDGSASGSLRAPGASPWSPHTHGAPTRYEVTLAGPDAEVLWSSQTGFRTLSSAVDLEADGPALRVNGEPIFCRGAVWTPLSLAAPVDPEAMREVLQRVVDAGMNMLRVPGIGCYEDDIFYELCDELGILVWQDFMFANLDYPEADPAFLEAVQAEVSALLERIAARPSLAVLCGGSEVAQQVAMLGLDPALASGPLYAELLPSLVRAADVDAPYIESAPWGGDLPFRPDRGVANYYGVGAYLRPLEDARRAEVRFAAECLAFANVPDDEALPARVVHDPVWKAGVPRDAGAGWDFDDVRDHYLRLLFEIDPLALRYSDPDRYLELSRAVSGEVMAETFGEWRRSQSPCGGALVLWLRDLAPGAGWGVLDHRGLPKVAYHHLRRALAPVAVWGVDEGLGGLVAHVGNDCDRPFAGSLRVALYRDWSVQTEQTAVELALAPHGSAQHNVEALLGRFVDITWAYRFGAPAQDLVTLTLLDAAGELVSQTFRYPAGRPTERLPLASLGLSGELERTSSDGWRVRVSSSRFAYGVRVRADGFAPADDAFGVEPGGERVVALRRMRSGDEVPSGWLSALNLEGQARIGAPSSLNQR